MPNDINELDATDYGLKQIFGNRFTDETEPKDAPTSNENKPTSDSAEPTKFYEDAEWKPERLVPNFFDRIKAFAKSTIIFGGLTLLIFYWQQAGLMDASIAVPSMCVCAALAGLGIGKSVARG